MNIDISQTELVALAVSTVCGWVTPAVVDLVTKSSLNSKIKASIAAGLSGIAGAASTVVFSPGEKWSSYFLAIGFAFVNTMSAHQTGYSGFIQKLTGAYGFGKKQEQDVTGETGHPSDEEASNVSAV